MYSYKQTESHLWTVGTEIEGRWHPESDHPTPEKAAKRCNYLNGGTVVGYTKEQVKELVTDAVRTELIEANKRIGLGDGLLESDYKYLGVVGAALDRLP